MEYILKLYTLTHTCYEQVVSSALNAQQEEEARTAIELFVDLGELDPTFLKPHLPTVVQAMITIATAPSLEDGKLNFVFFVAFLMIQQQLNNSELNFS